jgi:Firmicute plasmid replication protein (RepL)
METVLEKNESNNTKVSSIKELPSYKSNPFLESLRVPLAPRSNMFVKRDEAVINLSSGNIQEDVLLTGKRKYVDGEHFVKLFVKEMEVIFDLTRPAQKIFSYMLSKVEYDDKLHFDIKDCKVSLKYKSESQIFIGVKELMLNSFIAKTSWTNVYWINPKIFYKGDRLVILREYRRTKGKSVNNNQMSLFEEDNINKKLEDELELLELGGN